MVDHHLQSPPNGRRTVGDGKVIPLSGRGMTEGVGRTSHEVPRVDVRGRVAEKFEEPDLNDKVATRLRMEEAFRKLDELRESEKGS